MTSVVLDASAVLALLRKEPGGDLVTPHLRKSVISTVNYSEVLAKSVELKIAAETVNLIFGELGVTRIDFDVEHARAAAALRSLTRDHGLSLADRACLALAQVSGKPVLTTDRKWKEAVPEMDVRLIR